MKGKASVPPDSLHALENTLCHLHRSGSISDDESFPAMYALDPSKIDVDGISSPQAIRYGPPTARADADYLPFTLLQQLYQWRRALPRRVRPGRQ